ncbi:acyl-CoA dehydrogenase [Hylemonella gracilis str. Niagara R]|uniref:Acyl-CoA dehydrogenase n=1 Tax=Hylemonella gracilis str. Niagara R TaxID=1458275 RepID=A0A016XEL6_9BURK|nr:acyl-CoA dehydrogenase family protein [Hylemonella gracilis]EYC49648.1 acyl-CoA dehydrogenase [Hylemonella gracilis str. Niagara R]
MTTRSPDTLQGLLTDIRARAAEFERQRHISPDVIEAFKRLGVYRALLPKRLGGLEWSARQFCELIETIAEADGSAGWVASFGMAPTYLAALPPTTFEQIYRNNPDTVFAGGIFPPQPAPYVEGGIEVSGRWSFSSGCMGASVLGVGISPRQASAEGATSAGLPRMAVLPRAQATIVETWDVSGLAGTGSHDLVVDKVVVPEDWTFVRGGPSRQTETMFRYPTLAFAAQVLAVVGLGIARAAIEELRRMAGGHKAVTGAPSLGDRPATQASLARNEGQLRSARAWFYNAIDEAWDSLLKGDPVSPAQTSALRLSAAHAARTGAEVARDIQMLSGMAGIYNSSPIARCVRDANAVTQHAFLGDIVYQNAGAMAFGRDPLPGFL